MDLSRVLCGMDDTRCRLRLLTVQCSAVQCSAVQCSAVQCSVVLYSEVCLIDADWNSKLLLNWEDEAITGKCPPCDRDFLVWSDIVV